MSRRASIYYTAAQRTQMWDRWQRGDPLHDIARLFDRGHSSIQHILRQTGGIRPRERKRSERSLSFSERELISRGLAMEWSMRRIAARINRSPSTVSREANRNGGRGQYRACEAEAAAWRRALRPKPCKLSNRPDLVRAIAHKLQCEWSPQKISGWLKRQHPNDESCHVSHETLYKSLFIQARGVLKKELLSCLRSQRVMRRSRHETLKRKGLGTIVDAVSIWERPADVEDRAVPGHWEGDLIMGSNNYP